MDPSSLCSQGVTQSEAGLGNGGLNQGGSGLPFKRSGIDQVRPSLGSQLQKPFVETTNQVQILSPQPWQRRLQELQPYLQRLQQYLQRLEQERLEQLQRLQQELQRLQWELQWLKQEEERLLQELQELEQELQELEQELEQERRWLLQERRRLLQELQRLWLRQERQRRQRQERQQEQQLLVQDAARHLLAQSRGSSIQASSPKVGVDSQDQAELTMEASTIRSPPINPSALYSQGVAQSKAGLINGGLNQGGSGLPFKRSGIDQVRPSLGSQLQKPFAETTNQVQILSSQPRLQLQQRLRRLWWLRQQQELQQVLQWLEQEWLEQHLQWLEQERLDQRLWLQWLLPQELQLQQEPQLQRLEQEQQEQRRLQQELQRLQQEQRQLLVQDAARLLLAQSRGSSIQASSPKVGVDSQDQEELTMEASTIRSPPINPSPLYSQGVARSKAGLINGGYEVFERMAYYGIATNLVIFFTTELYEGTVPASNNVTNWVGTVWMTPILGAYIADAHLGRYWTFVMSSCIYLMGMCLLTLSVWVPWLKPPPCEQGTPDVCRERVQNYKLGIFYCALYIIALGTGGTKPNISTMGADQFDDFEPKERAQKLSFFNWWMFSIFFGTLFSNTFLVYIQDNVGWALGYGLPTIGLAFSIAVFLGGTRFYRHKVPSGSPFTRIARVLVAAVRKWRVAHPADPKELHELALGDYTKMRMFRIDHTPSLRFLDKAAVKNGPNTPWMLSTVTQVEETKQMIKMVPILAATFIPSTMIAQVHTLFIKQGTTLNRHMGPHFEIPPASLTAFVTIAMLISLVIYDRYLVPAIRKYTKNPRGITLLQRMGIGMVVHVIIMVIAAQTERRRLSYAREHGIVGAKAVVPLTIFTLLPQFALMGVADTFVEVAKIEFFYDQAPEAMKSLGTSYFTSSLGIGNFLSSFILTTVSDITKKNGQGGWIQNNLNISHLDYYYSFLAVLTALNFCFFILVAKFYVYNVDVMEANLQLSDASDHILLIKASTDENEDMKDGKC